MLIKKYILSLLAVAIFATASVSAQTAYIERAKRYVEQYYAMAIADQRSSGVPAAITLGQGILETEAGASELMTQANNHFGIKCGTGWNGPSFLHTDDAENECFKKYGSAAESYADHSAHLKRNPRYASLFKIPITNYASWAAGLRRCGYATDPQYAQRLIKIIEDFQLQSYTLTAMDSNRSQLALQVEKQQTPVIKEPVLVNKLEDTTLWVIDKSKTTEKEDDNDEEMDVMPATINEPVTKSTVAVVDTISTPKTVTGEAAGDIRSIADSARFMVMNKDTAAQTPLPVVPPPPVYDTNGIVRIHGLKAFYAHKDETLLQYAMKFNLRYPKLLEMNDLADAPLPVNSYIFLEKKLAAGVNTRHIVEEGETLWLISQKEAIQLKRLTALNLLSPDETPVAGTVLQLQFPLAKKPDVKSMPTSAHKGNAIILINKQDKEAVVRDTTGYITLKNGVSADESDTGFIHITDTATTTTTPGSKTKTPLRTTKTPVKPKAAPLPIPEAPKPLVEKYEPVVIITTAAPNDKNSPVQWVNKDTVKKEIPVAAATTDENGEDPDKQELARLKAQLDKVVYADDSKLVAKMQSEQPAQKANEELSAPKNSKFYIVKKGDTAYSIAKKNSISVAQLLKWNDIDTSEIKPGKKLVVSR